MNTPLLIGARVKGPQISSINSGLKKTAAIKVELSIRLAKAV
jgi:hypothetical protein